MDTLMFLLVPVLIFAIFAGISGLITGFIAHKRQHHFGKWFVVGVVLPYFAIALALLWPRPQFPQSS